MVAEGWTISEHHYAETQAFYHLFKGDGTSSTSAQKILSDGEIYDRPKNVMVDPAGNIYVVGAGQIFKNGTPIAGVPLWTEGSVEDGIPALEARLGGPIDLSLDTAGNLYISLYYITPDSVGRGGLIRKVDVNGIITTVAGGGDSSGDGIPATEALLKRPVGIALDSEENIYIADSEDHRIRKVDVVSGVITTVAGGLFQKYNILPLNDGKLATEGRLRYPGDVAFDSIGNLYIADKGNHRIRKVDAVSGIITTYAGSVTGCQPSGCVDYGDYGPAVNAILSDPIYIAFDEFDNLYIMQHYTNRFTNYRLRRVDATSGIIATLVVFKEYYPNTSGPDLNDSHPLGIATSPSGTLYIADLGKDLVNHLKISNFSITTENGSRVIINEASGVNYVMDLSSGIHRQTVDRNTGVALYSFEYDQNDNLISITDQFGNQTSFERDFEGIPTAIVSPDGLRTGLTVDDNNHLTQIVLPDDNSYLFEYSPGGLMTVEVDPRGNRFDHIFYSTGKVSTIFDQEGGVWEFSSNFDENGDIITEVLTAEANLTTYFDHTALNGAYTSTITSPDDSQTLFSMSADGLNTTKSLPCGMELSYEYDIDPEYLFKGVKILRESTPSELVKTISKVKSYYDNDFDSVFDLITNTVTVNGKSTTIENDILSSMRTIISPEGRTLSAAFDPENLLTTSVSVPGFYDTVLGYDAKGRLISTVSNTRSTYYGYDSYGYLSFITDPEGYTTSFNNDVMGRVVTVHRPDGSYLGFSYDANGNMTVLTNPNLVDHQFGQNTVNRRTSYQTPLSGSYNYVYDRDRRLVQTNFPSGRQINNIYDTTRLSQVQTPEGNIDYSYLCNSKVDTVSKGTESISYDYDGKLVTSESLSGTLAQTLLYGYNNDFNLASFTYGGSTASYTYDNDNLLTGAGSFAISRNVTNGLPETVSDGSFFNDRTFNGHGEVVGSAVSVYGQGLAVWIADRDNTGRVISKSETVAGVTSDYNYVYDEMGRLLTVHKDGTLVEEYQYDVTGTRVYEMNSLRGIVGRSMAYSDEDHLLTAGGAVYDYDLDGFLTAKTKGTEVTSYDYSSRGELLNVSLPDGRLVEYVHDPLGRRIAKKVGSVIVEKYLWLGLTRLLAVYDGSDNLLMRFEYEDGRTPMVMTMAGATYYLAYDQVGSLRIVADGSGNIVKKIDYDSFGSILSDNNPALTIPLGFAGGLHDRDVGLVRFGHRDYDPDTGRWTTKDPILFAGGDTDLFGYVQNDPINFVDPDGLYRIPGAGKALGWALERLAKKLGGELGDVLGEWADLFNTEISHPPEQQDMDIDSDNDGINDYTDNDDDNDGIPDDQDGTPKGPDNNGNQCK